VDLTFYGRELVRDFWVERKMNCQRFNINVTLVDFLRHEKFAVRGVVLNLTAMIFN